MRRPEWISRGPHVRSLVKWDSFLLPIFFLLNLFLFASWVQLIQLATKPWLTLVWLYAGVVLVPLIWRHKAPLAVFTIEWVLTVIAWPFMPYYTPIIGVPVSLHAVSVLRDSKTSLLALLVAFIPTGLGAAVAFRVSLPREDQLLSFVPNAIFLVAITVSAWGAGRLMRASQQRVQELERERDTVLEAVAAERRRIARELRDIVSDTTGKKAMAELRRVLRLLEASDLPRHAMRTNEPESLAGVTEPDRAARLTDTT
jgi:signal transduction histidine kinase